MTSPLQRFLNNSYLVQFDLNSKNDFWHHLKSLISEWFLTVEVYVIDLIVLNDPGLYLFIELLTCFTL